MWVPEILVSPEFEEAAPGQDPVDDGLGEVGVVEDVGPGGPTPRTCQLVQLGRIHLSST